MRIRKRFYQRSANKFTSNFKNNHPQSIIKRNDGLKIILYGEYRAKYKKK